MARRGEAVARARVEAVFERPPGVHAALIYAIDDMRGNDLQPPPTRDPRRLADASTSSALLGADWRRWWIWRIKR